MKEVINVSVGGGGIQVANACWELFCLQHRIELSGQIDRTPNPNQIYLNQAFRTFFSQTEEGRFIPRAVHIDLEPSVLDEVRTGKFKELFRPQGLIGGKENAASNYAYGYYSAGKPHIDLYMEGIRREVERCDAFQGFLFNSAVGGGTGSGLGSLLLERMDADFGKKAVLSFNIFPSPRLSRSEVEPYDSVLATRSLIQRSEVSTIMDNQALHDICTKNLEINSPTYTNINRIIAQTVSSITASIRFGGALHVDLSEFSANLIPFPRINFMLSSYSPIVNTRNADFQCMSTTYLCNQLYEPANMMAKCDHRHGKFLACTQIFRGNFTPKDIGACICTLKTRRNIRFVDWCPTGFKVGINYHAPMPAILGSNMADLQRSCCMISNSTSIKSVFARINHKFDDMYVKRAYVHSYLEEGMEQAELEEAREELARLEIDYYEIEKEQQGQEEAQEG